MIRAIAGLILIMATLAVSVFSISVLVNVTGSDGALAVIIGIPVCLGALALSVIILELINSRINDKTRDKENTNRKFLH